MVIFEEIAISEYLLKNLYAPELWWKALLVTYMIKIISRLFFCARGFPWKWPQDKAIYHILQ